MSWMFASLGSVYRGRPSIRDASLIPLSGLVDVIVYVVLFPDCGCLTSSSSKCSACGAHVVYRTIARLTMVEAPTDLHINLWKFMLVE